MLLWNYSGTGLKRRAQRGRTGSLEAKRVEKVLKVLFYTASTIQICTLSSFFLEFIAPIISFANKSLPCISLLFLERMMQSWNYKQRWLFFRKIQGDWCTWRKPCIYTLLPVCIHEASDVPTVSDPFPLLMGGGLNSVQEFQQ